MWEDSEFDISRSFSDILGQASINGEPAGGQKLKAFDERGKMTHEVTVANDGSFELSSMPNGSDFTVEIVPTDGVDPADISLELTSDKDETLQTQTLENGKFAFSSPEPIGASDEPINGVKTLTSGVFKYHGFRKSGASLQLLNSNEELIETVSTDDNGQFFFSKMMAATNYLVRAKDLGPAEMENAQLFFIGKSGEVTSAYEKPGTNLFTFDPLVDDYYSQMGKMDVEDSEFDISRSFSDILGQASINGEPAGGQKLKAFDERGKMTHEVTVANDGSFELSSMPNGSDFTVEIVPTDGVDPADISLELTSDKDETLQTQTLENGKFAFSSPEPISVSNKAPEAKSDPVPKDDDGEAMLATLSAIGEDINLFDEVDFTQKSTELNQENRFKLYYAYKELLKTSGPILIVGFAFDSESPTERENIARERANQVREYFLRVGVDSSRIQTVTISNALVGNANPSQDELQENRKAQIFLQTP